MATQSNRGTTNPLLAAGSLIATPWLLFVSTTVSLYLENQLELDHQVSLLAPFFGLAIMTLLVGAALWGGSRFHFVRFLLWGYYIATPMFLIYSLLRAIPLEVLEQPLGTSTFLIAWLGLSAFAAARTHPCRVTPLFVLIAGLFIVSDVVRFGLREQGFPEQPPDPSPPKVRASELGLPNIYHVLLDGFQSDVFSLILSQELEDSLAGFTYYPKASAIYSTTEWSVPSVFLGAYYDFTMPRASYQDLAFNSQSSLLRYLKDVGYSTLAYTRKIYPMQLQLFDDTVQHVDNVKSDLSMDLSGAFSSLWVYRIFPRFITRLLSERAWLMHPETFRNLEDETFLPDSAPQESLLSFRQILEQEAALPEANRYTFIHLLLPHAPYVFQSDCTRSNSATVTTQTECAVTMLLDLVNRLKKLDRFQRSMIIVHGDHGERFVMRGGKLVPAKARSPNTLLLVKPFAVDARIGLVHSDTEATILDVAPTVVDAIGLPAAGHHEGTSLMDSDSWRPAPDRFYYVVGGERMVKHVIRDGRAEYLATIAHGEPSPWTPADPESVPVFAASQIVEAEAGYLSTAAELGTAIPGVSGQYVSNGTKLYRFAIERDGTFQLWARLVTPSGNNNSCYLMMGNGGRNVWNMEKSRSWRWQGAPVQWELRRGIHLLTIEYREPVHFDQLELRPISIP